MKISIPLLLSFISAVPAFSQTVLWDGESSQLGSKGGLWDDGSPAVVTNPSRSGINTSEKCLKFTMTNGSKMVKVPFRDWIKPDLKGNRRFSLMIKKTTNCNVNIEISDPTDGSNGYWEKVAAWYGGSGEWQKVVFDFSTNTALGDHPGVMAITASTDDVNGSEDVYIDNIVVEDVPTVNGTPLSQIADNSLSGKLTLSGSWMQGDCQNADGDWQRVEYNDFATLAAKCTASVTSIDMRGTVLKGAYNAVGGVNPNILIYADTDFGEFNVIGNGSTSDLRLNENYSFNAPFSFTADKITLTRTVKDGTNALCLPFAVNSGELGAADAAIYQSCNVSNGTADVYLTPVSSVAANTPFILYGATTADKLTFSNKQIEATPQTLGSILAGNYEIGNSGKGYWGSNEDNWDATSFIQSWDAPSQDTYYKPDGAFIGDPIAYYDSRSGSFKILYLYDRRPNPTDTYHPIYGLSTTDAANYIDLGCILPTGGINDQDAALGTGSVAWSEADNLYYLFYTGNRYQPSASQAPQVIMMATSPDFKNWTKHKDFIMKPEDYDCGRYDFRDPSVFKADDGLWHMVITSRMGDQGFLMEFTSSDLKSWHNAGRFMNSVWDRSYECPDVFKMGNWWYLVYSEQNDNIRRVQYFKGHTLDELRKATTSGNVAWPDGHEGYLDGRALYAGRTASNGTDRFLWGWCPTRANDDNTAVSNTAAPEWGGNLVAYKLIQHNDGTLTLGQVDAITRKYATTQNVEVVGQSENGVTSNGNNFVLQDNAYLQLARLSAHNRISFTVTTSGNNDKFGISLVRGSDSQKYYSLVVNPETSTTCKVNLEEEGNDGKGFIAGADSYIFDRPANNVFNITLVTDNSVCVMYINDVLCHTSRIYGINKNCWSINSYSGKAVINNLKITTY